MVNSHGNVVIPIPGEIMAVDTRGRVVSAEGVYDYNLAKDLETINSEVRTNIQNLQNLIDTAGEGGTTNYSELINKPKINNIELEGNVTLEIPDSYTKTESDAKYLTEHQDISGKADKIDVYTKEEVEYLIGQGGNFDPNLYYTKTDIDEKGYLTLHQNIDGKANVGDSYTKSLSDNKYALKTDLNNKVDNITLADYALKSEIPERVYVDSSIDSTSTNPVLNKVIYEELRTKQNNLVGGVNIKNLKDYNSENVYNLIGEGSISFKTINGKSLLGAGDIEVVVPGDEAGDGEGGEPGGSSGGSGKGEMNVIEYVSFNGNIVPIENKTAMITASIPTQLSLLEQNNNYTTVSQVERTTWNNKSNFSGSYNDLTNKPTFKTINGENIKGVGNIEIPSSSSPSDDSNLVHKTGDETITGNKIFNGQVSFESGDPVYFEGDNMVRGDVFITNNNSGATNVQITTDNNNDNRVVVKASETGFSWIQASNGTLDLQSVLDSKLTSSSIPALSKGTTTGSGNAVTDISVSGHTITLTKGTEFLTTGASSDDILYDPSVSASTSNIGPGLLTTCLEDIDDALDTKQNTSDKVTSISSSSTNTQYPSALAVYNALSTKQNTLVSGENIKTINGTSILGSGNITINSSSGQGIKMYAVVEKSGTYKILNSSGDDIVVFSTIQTNLFNMALVYNGNIYRLDSYSPVASNPLNVMGLRTANFTNTEISIVSTDNDEFTSISQRSISVVYNEGYYTISMQNNSINLTGNTVNQTLDITSAIQ